MAAAIQRNIIRWKTLRQRIGVSASTVWRAERDGKFPKGVALSPHSIGWVEDEVKARIGDRIREKADTLIIPAGQRVKYPCSAGE